MSNGPGQGWIAIQRLAVKDTAHLPLLDSDVSMTVCLPMLSMLKWLGTGTGAYAGCTCYFNCWPFSLRGLLSLIIKHLPEHQNHSMAGLICPPPVQLGPESCTITSSLGRLSYNSES